MAAPRARRPLQVIVCINRFDVRDVWAVRWGYTWFTGTHVRVMVPLTTVFKGLRARQPIAYLRGRGVVRQRGRRITVTET